MTGALRILSSKGNSRISQGVAMSVWRCRFPFPDGLTQPNNSDNLVFINTIAVPQTDHIEAVISVNGG